MTMLAAVRVRAALAAALMPLLAAACGGGGGGKSADSGFGYDQRTEVPALPLPFGLPEPEPAPWTNAYPGLVFDRPIAVAALPDGSDRLVVAEQQGRLVVFADDPGTTVATEFLDLRSRVQFGGEEGLLGLAFHPDYASNGWLYVYYSAGSPRRSVIARFSRAAGDANTIDPGSEVVLLEIPQPFSNHNAGCLQFGPDGMLYVASGDGGSGNDPFDNAQDLTTLLGKVLRLAPDGSIPNDNPFAGGSGGGGSGGGQRGEIWAYGLRNPFRMAFDASGRLWVGDVGQGAFEEIDLVARGQNLGWPLYEGERSNKNPTGVPASAFTPPVWTYGRGDGVAVIGGQVYRGSAVPALVGACRTETLRTVFGLDETRAGRVRVFGKPSTAVSPSRRLAEGVGLLSEDRKAEGLLLGRSLADNLTLTRLDPVSRWGLVSDRRQTSTTAAWMRRLDVRAQGPGQAIGELSGGNQQKVAIGRLLHHEAKVLLLDEPTRGIDVGSKAQIYRLIGDLAVAGKSIVFVSSYLPELMGICDTIAVMCRGVVVDVRPVERWTEHAIMAAAIGQGATN